MKNSFYLFILAFAVATFASCKGASGEKAEVTEAEEVTPEATTGTDYSVNLDASTIMWEGAKPTGKHTGTLSLSDGSLSVNGNSISGGSFTIDMNTINVTDLEGDEKAYLEAHLKGTNEDKADDFFNVNKYPTASFVITKVTDLEGDAENNAMVYGNLTMKDIEKQVGFKANVDMTGDMAKVTTPFFTINRTDWGIKYGSPSFFEGLKDKAINDEMGIKIELQAAKNPS